LTTVSTTWQKEISTKQILIQTDLSLDNCFNNLAKGNINKTNPQSTVTDSSLDNCFNNLAKRNIDKTNPHPNGLIP
jgi:hypothetical protein